MRGDFTLKILEILESAIHTSADIIDIFTCGYLESYRKARKSMSYSSYYQSSAVNSLYNHKDNQNFYSHFYYLQKNSLVKKTKKAEWQITGKGKIRLQKLKKWRRKILFKKGYRIQKSNDLKIVIFDIPERERKKRDWLRCALLSLEFSMLQKSAWMGKNVLPKEFMEDLKKLNILPYIKIFVIEKGGNMQELE